MKSFIYFTAKARVLKNDPILSNLLYADNVIFDTDGKLKILSGDQYEFFKV